MDQSELYELYDRDPEPIVEFLEHLRTVYELPRPGTILDMGCGPGRLLARLAESDWAVVGYEPDPDYAGRAEATLRRLPRGRFRQAGILELDEAQAFDLIAAVNGPYSYLLTVRERREAVERCAGALRPGGVLFLEYSDFNWILANYREPPIVVVDVRGVQVRRSPHHVIDHYQGTFTHHDRFTWQDESGTAQLMTKAHRMAMVSFPELASLLGESGFRRVQTFNGYDDRTPSELTGRKILVSAQLPPLGGRAS